MKKKKTTMTMAGTSSTSPWKPVGSLKMPTGQELAMPSIAPKTKNAMPSTRTLNSLAMEMNTATTATTTAKTDGTEHSCLFELRPANLDRLVYPPITLI